MVRVCFSVASKTDSEDEELAAKPRLCSAQCVIAFVNQLFANCMILFFQQRTKESNNFASTEVANLRAQWKWQWLEFLHSPPASIPRENGKFLNLWTFVEIRWVVLHLD